MTARGIKCNWNDAGTPAYAFITAAGANRFDMGTIDVTICGWITVRGDKGASSTSIGMPFAWIGETTNTGANCRIHATDADGSFQHSPWTYVSRYMDSSFAQADFGSTGNNVATNQNWFFALVWDHAAAQWTMYYAVDGGSLSASTATSVTYTGADPFNHIELGRENDNAIGANVEITNVKVWKRVFSSAELTAEKTSEAMVITTAAWAHWKLASSADLTDYSGNSRSLTLSGSVGDGTMDPTDIQGGASGSGCRWYGILKA